MSLITKYSPFNLSAGFLLSSMSCLTASNSIEVDGKYSPQIPGDVVSEISQMLDEKSQYRLALTSKSAKDSLKIELQRLEKFFLNLSPESELAVAYGNLPDGWKTPRSLLAITKNKMLLGQFAGVLPKSLIDFLTALGVWDAAKIKSGDLRNGDYGIYSRNQDESISILERFAGLGYPEAIELVILDLSFQDMLSGNCSLATKSYIEDKHSQGLWAATHKKIEGLCYGIFGYDTNLPEARSIIEEYHEKGLWQAGMIKFTDLATGDFGYEKNVEAAHALLDEMCSNMVWSAIRLKISCLSEGRFGIGENLSLIPKLLDRAANYGIAEAIKMKYDALLEGTLGYDKNPDAAMDLFSKFPATIGQYNLHKFIRATGKKPAERTAAQTRVFNYIGIPPMSSAPSN